MAVLGPKRPLRKPRPTAIEFAQNNVAFVDSEEGFTEGSEIFVCTEENTPEFDLLDSGLYFLANGDQMTVINGVIDEIN